MAIRRAIEEHRATRFEAVATFVAAWITLGVYLVGWALQSGQIDSATFSLYHVPAYLGLIALLAVVGERMFDRSGRSGPGGRIRSAWNGRSTGERVIVAGTLAVVTYVVGDLVWQVLFGVDAGLEGRQAPTRLLIPVGVGLVASGWIVSAARDSHPVGWLGVLGFATMLALGFFWIGDWHPVFSARQASSPVVTDPLTTEIWTMAPDGGTQTRVVGEGPGEATQPAFSPDGTRIVYVHWEEAEQGDLTADLWIVDADGRHAHQLTGSSEWEWIPAWSPDGSWIAYTSREPPAETQPAPVGQPEAGGAPDVTAPDQVEWALYLIRPDGSERHRVVTGGDSMAPVWSPDGHRLAYHGTRQGNLDLFVADADGSNELRVTDDPGHDWSPVWSTDGGRLVFTSDRAGNDDVWVVAVDGSNPTRLTTDAAADQVPVWSPDGGRIVFVSDRTGDPEIWSMASDGSDLANLSQSPVTADGRWSVGWPSAGGRLVFARAYDSPLSDEPLVRLDLGLAGLLLTALLLTLLALAVDGVGGLPIGGFAIVVGTATLLVASVSDGWRFVPAGVAAGLVGDAIGRMRPGPVRRALAAALVPASFVLADLLILVATGSLGWSVTLSTGAVVASAMIGLLVAAATAIRAPRVAAPTTD